MISVNIILPKRFNDGNIIPDEKFERFEKQILQKFTGFSKSEIRGVWVHSSGRVYRDNGWKYEIAFREENSPIAEDYFVTLKDELKKEFEQQEIFIMVFEVHII